MSTLSGEISGKFHTLYIRVTENGQTRLVNILSLLPSQVPMLFEDPPSTTLTSSQYGIVQWVLAQNFLNTQSYVPSNRVGSVSHSLIQELALVRYLNNSLFQGISCEGRAICDTVSLNWPAGSSTKEDLATILGAISGQGTRKGWTTIQQDQNYHWKPTITRTTKKYYKTLEQEQNYHWKPTITRSSVRNNNFRWIQQDITYNFKKETKFPTLQDGVLTCSSQALSFSPLPSYLLQSALGQVSLLKDGQAVSTISVLPSPVNDKFLGFSGSTLQLLDPPAASA